MIELKYFVDMRGMYPSLYRDPDWILTLLTYLFISIFSIIPSIFILYLFAKNMLYRNNFHYIVMHWTTANLASIITTIVCTTMRAHIRRMENITFFTDTDIRTIPVVFGIFFIFNKFLRSQKCPHIISAIWIVFGVMLVVGNVCSNSLTHFGYYISLTYVFIVADILAIILLITVLFRYCVIGSDEETLKLRLIMLAIYLVSSIGQWIYTAFNPRIASSVGLFVTSMFFYSNSLINLALLVIYEKYTREYFWQYVEKHCQRLTMRLTAEKLEVLVSYRAILYLTSKYLISEYLKQQHPPNITNPDPDGYA